jgi:hypothetical protein
LKQLRYRRRSQLPERTLAVPEPALTSPESVLGIPESALTMPGTAAHDPGIGARLRPESALSMGRNTQPGAASESEVRLRDRTQVKWRSDSAAVAINTRDTFYAHNLVIARDRASGRFAAVPIPPYAELAGRPTPPAEKLRSRGRSIAIRWTAEGLLVLETWLWGEVDYPLSYRVSLQLTGDRLVVHDRQPITQGTPSW